MEIVINRNGDLHCIYGEDVDLSSLGKVSIARGSYVEPTDDGQWMAELSPVDGPVLGPFRKRTDALRAEYRWLQRNWLPQCAPSLSRT